MGDATQAQALACAAEHARHCWHQAVLDVFSAPTDFLEWGDRLLSLGLCAGPGPTLTRLAGSRQWADPSAVYRLATALEALAEGPQAPRTADGSTLHDAEEPRLDVVHELSRLRASLSELERRVEASRVTVEKLVLAFAGRADAAGADVRQVDHMAHLVLQAWRDVEGGTAHRPAFGVIDGG